MVPAKTKPSGIRQYMPKKIHKWGFKNLVRAGNSGIIYDFFIYAGAKSAGRENFQLFMDNWFFTLSILSELKSMGILTIATFRSNRLGRGSYDYRKDKNTGTHLLKWFDNKCVVVGLTFAGVDCTKTVERYDVIGKKKVKIDCPDIIEQYNKSMGGVDLADMLI